MVEWHSKLDKLARIREILALENDEQSLEKLLAENEAFKQSQAKSEKRLEALEKKIEDLRYDLENSILENKKSAGLIARLSNRVKNRGA